MFCVSIPMSGSEYNHTQQIFVNSYPWLFPGGVGDIYDMEQGEVPIIEWGQHLLQYFDGQFLDNPLFGLSLYNTIQCHTNNREGSFFSNLTHSLGNLPPHCSRTQKTVDKQGYQIHKHVETPVKKYQGGRQLLEKQNQRS
jgi:hypothetical protein